MNISKADQHLQPASGLPNMLPPPARLLYRALWRPGYARTPRWVTATI